MLESIFLTINAWMTASLSLAAVGCLLWGIISVVFSPCHLASIPLIVAYVGGQDKVLRPKEAALYSIVFTLGLFITIAVIGIICALLGRMLGDVGSYWQIIVGIFLIWVALGMLGVEKFAMSGSLLARFHFRGIPGAFALGLGYGVLSGSCTFGFIAPILAIITIQQKIGTGILLIMLFAVGHCTPIVVAGSSTALVKKVVENCAWQGAGNWFRKGAGAVICLLGIYFIVNPLVGTF
ncbi:MAG: cytochrome c biogenesis protein CcdA [Desulfatiglandaceae bacterium]